MALFHPRPLPLVLLSLCALPALGQAVAPGITYATETHGGISGHVVRVDHRVAAVRVRVTPESQRYQTVPQYVSAHGALAGINASYFRPYYTSPSMADAGEANGVTVSDGKPWTHDYDDQRLHGYFAWDDGVTFFRMHAMSAPVPASATQAVGAFRAVVSGVACDGSQPAVCHSFTANRTHQTAFGVDKERNVTFLAVVNNATPPEVARFMRDIGAYDAINLDSGGSSQLFAGTSRVSSTRKVINAILVTPGGVVRPPDGGEPDAGVDAGAGDAGADGGQGNLDGGGGGDAGVGDDAGAQPDAGAGDDAGAQPDAGAGDDAGAQPDAGAGGDGYIEPHALGGCGSAGALVPLVPALALLLVGLARRRRG